MTSCPTFYINPESSSGCATAPVDDFQCVDCCNCGYIQFESLLPYLKEIRSSLRDDIEQSSELEFKLRDQIIEISRLFDIETGVEPGYFSKAHYNTTQVFPTNGSKYIKIPNFVKDTLDVRTTSNHLLNSNSYGFQDGFLVYHPCSAHYECGCDDGCGNERTFTPQPWPDTCYKVTARWGKECADQAVQMAIRDYLIEGYRVKDPVIIAATGLPIGRYPPRMGSRVTKTAEN